LAWVVCSDVPPKRNSIIFVGEPTSFCFNEQGTGKTASSIWASDYLIDQGLVKPSAYHLPLSIMQSAWQADLFKFAVHRTIKHSLRHKKQRIEAIESACEYLIINYDGIETVKNELKNGGFNLVIVDEANAYKNHRTNGLKLSDTLSMNTRGYG
jgi:SNF2 family DNA or RNA helicase